MFNKIEPKISLTVDIHSHLNIPFIITDDLGNILAFTSVSKLGCSNFNIRYKCIEMMEILRTNYAFDTIIMEENQLFIDKIDRYPDPYVLRNIVLGFGIKTSIEDKYYYAVQNIIELPEKEWRNKVLNAAVKYSIDLYKAHVENRELSSDIMKVISENNFFKAVCLSESVLYPGLMNKKYKIN